MKKRKNRIGEAVWLNDQTYLDYKYRLKKIATSIFEWKNLPDSMDAEYIEYCLYAMGQCALLKTEEYGFINTKATINGNINLYGKPTALNCYSFGSVQYNRNVYYGGEPKDEYSECILVKNTQDIQPMPTVATIELYAYRLYQAERTADVNVQNAKRSRLILTSENQRLTMENLFRQYDSNVPYIFGDSENFKRGTVESLDISSAFIGSDIMKYKEQITNEFLTFLGVNNIQEKKERLISDEVGTNNEVINLNLMSFLAPRQKACELFNKKYGTNIEVKVRSDLDNIIKTYASSIAEDYEDKIAEDTVETTAERVIQ